MTQLVVEPEATDSTRQATSAEPRRRPAPRALLAVAAALVLVLPLAARTLDILPNWGNPFSSKVVDHSPAPLVLALRDLAEYHAATGTFQALVDVEHDTTNLPSLISGERVTFLAVGGVDAVVDFSAIGQDRVQASADRRSVTISLPAPRLAEATIDHDASRVLDRDRGLLQRIGAVFEENPTSERELYQLAEAKLNAAASRTDLVQRAEQNTRTMLTGLAQSLGYDQVTVTFDTPQV
jgi:uncharacterized protein DUF4230